MVSRRQFLFGAAAGTAALSVSQSMAGKIVSAFLAPSPIPAVAPVVAADIAQSTYCSLIRAMTEITRNAKHSFQFIPTGHNETDMSVWQINHENTVIGALSDLVYLMESSGIQDLEAERLSAQKWCAEKFQHLGTPGCDTMFYYGPMGLMDKFKSRETILAQIPEILDRTMLTLAQTEKTRPPGFQSRSVSMDNMHMFLLNGHTPALQNGASYNRRGTDFTERTHGLYYKYTPDNLKFLAELEFLQRNNFLARVFTLPEREQSILDTVEANPANWALLLKSGRDGVDRQTIVDRLIAAFPERAENVRIYEAALKREEKKHDFPWSGSLPCIDIPWNIVVQMQDKPDAFVPIMQAAIEESKQSLKKLHRDSISRSCKGKTTFTQTVSGEADVQSLQGILRGFFVIYPDKAKALETLRSTFSAAVNLVVEGDDILLEAKPEMNEQDRLLIEDLSGVDMGQMAFAMPLKQPVPLS